MGTILSEGDISVLGSSRSVLKETRTSVKIKLAPRQYQSMYMMLELVTHEKKVQVGKDQEKAQSEKDSHSKNQGGKKPN